MSLLADPFWDELGVAWRAGGLRPAQPLMPALRMQLKREALRQRILVAADCLGAIAGIIAALWAFSQKSAPCRFYGTMMLATTLVCVGLSVWVHATRARGDMESLVGMLDLASSGARKRQRFGRSLFISAWFLVPIAMLIPLGVRNSRKPGQDFTAWQAGCFTRCRATMRDVETVTEWFSAVKCPRAARRAGRRAVCAWTRL